LNEQDVFISYASETQGVADKVYRTLTDKGVKCWIAHKDAQPGRSYSREIVRAINKCQVFLLVLDQYANQSHFVCSEVERAFAKQKPIMVLRIEDIEVSEDLELFLGLTHWINAFETTPEQYFDAMYDAINKILSPDMERQRKTGEIPVSKKRLPTFASSKNQHTRMYLNLASSESPSIILVLIDISHTMEKNSIASPGETRIETALELLRRFIIECVQRSFKQKEINPRYRIGMFAYGDELFDLNEGVRSIGEIAAAGIPQLSLLEGRSNVSKAFRYAGEVLNEEIKKYSSVIYDIPTPIVINITGDLSIDHSSEENLFTAVEQVRALSVPDGNVLVQNIFIPAEGEVGSAESQLYQQNFVGWQGFGMSEDLRDDNLNKWLRLSSPLPRSYFNSYVDLGCSFQMGTRMLFPGTLEGFLPLFPFAPMTSVTAE
jgi:hypothetical protein